VDKRKYNIYQTWGVQAQNSFVQIFYYVGDLLLKIFIIWSSFCLFVSSFSGELNTMQGLFLALSEVTYHFT
jgi:hypothetical protein